MDVSFTGRTFSREVATRLATQLNAADDEWTYVVDAQGDFARVVVYDENNQFLGVL